jgi:hypothetical protein
MFALDCQIAAQRKKATKGLFLFRLRTLVWKSMEGLPLNWKNGDM